ncbi:unnamed protein product [Paramecium sonneborni]|uniref:Uncharacterized protein n=1 Tax=Paramecium sonneborni TaxID=65129 RepID=A0A8S1RTG2_9CILI|nr:unnamed protein product [Paramecium sonneborni]
MPETRIRQIQFPLSFASNLKHYTNLIIEQAQLFYDKYHQEDVLCAIIQFQNNKEHIQKLCINQALNQYYYDLIQRSFENIMKQLVAYLKVFGYIFHSLLQICNDFLRVLFYFQQINESRFMQEKVSQQLKEYISEIEEQITVESKQNQLSGTDFEFQMIKIGIEHLRTKSETGKNLMKSVLFGIVSSFSQLKPSEEFMDSLKEAGKILLLNFYNKQIKILWIYMSFIVFLKI